MLLRCELERYKTSSYTEKERIVVWLPESLCYVDKKISYKLHRNDDWSDGWRVAAVYDDEKWDKITQNVTSSQNDGNFLTKIRNFATKLRRGNKNEAY